MGNPEIKRDPKPPSRSTRSGEVRRLNAIEAKKAGNVVVVHGGEDADTTDEGTAEWGPPILVTGYERIMLLLDFTFGDGGNDITTALIAAQASPVSGELAEHWFDVFADEVGDGVLVRKVWEVPATADTRVAWQDQLRVSYYMRFKVWTNGTTRTDSRATLKAQRVMDSM